MNLKQIVVIHDVVERPTGWEAIVTCVCKDNVRHPAKVTFATQGEAENCIGYHIK